MQKDSTLKLNSKNVDGSVNSFYQTQSPGHGYYVPYGIDEFETQIEENILPAVLLLNAKGYKTITSCHGHSKFDLLFNRGIRQSDGPQITIGVTIDQLDNIKAIFNTLFVTTKDAYNINIHEHQHYISLCSRKWISIFFTNKFLCDQIYKLCKKIT